MGSARRSQPKKLASKLLQIRMQFDLTQEQMAQRLRKTSSSLRRAHISRFELGQREPSLLLLLAYARLAGVAMEVLVDDALQLPQRIPGPAKQRRTSIKK